MLFLFDQRKLARVTKVVVSMRKNIVIFYLKNATMPFEISFVLDISFS
jgi:hypothetical protein